MMSTVEVTSGEGAKSPSIPGHALSSYTLPPLRCTAIRNSHLQAGNEARFS